MRGVEEEEQVCEEAEVLHQEEAVEVQEVADNVDEGVDGEVRFLPRSSSCAIHFQGMSYVTHASPLPHVIIQYILSAGMITVCCLTTTY